MTPPNEKTNSLTIDLPAIKQPKGGGAIKGLEESINTDAFTGSATFDIAIPVSKARDLKLDIKLSYNSRSGNGAFGLGFSLNLSRIYRNTSLGIPKYKGTDIFEFSEEGMLLPEDNGTRKEGDWTIQSYLPRRNDSFSSIEKWTNTTTCQSYWKIKDRKNTTHIYGKNQESQIFNPTNNQQVFEWLIDSSTDSKGNKILYKYKAENLQNVPPEIFEQNHVTGAQRYIQSIQYGNYINEKEEEKYAFELIFDYGEYNLSNLDQAGSNPYQATQDWSVRPDPFSSFQSGFEIRTSRLCQNILSFHHFEELGTEPCLVMGLNLGYQLSKVISLTTSIVQNGYQRKNNDNYDQKPYPPLGLSYSTFEVESHPQFQQLKIDNGGNIPGYMNQSQFLPVDLYGEGLPGVLYNGGATHMYYSPLGNGLYSDPQAMTTFPTANDIPDGSASLSDLEGNNNLQLVSGKGTSYGYYALEADGSWQNFESFKKYPTEIDSSWAEQTDLDGNGKSDLLLIGTDNLRMYLSQGIEGYGNPVNIPKATDLPKKAINDKYELVTFANMFGDGLSHRVRIANGIVECWPNLGYGQFGEKITFGNAPSPAEAFDVDRVFLSDIDGSGTTDLIFAYDDRVEVYFNQSGNSFSDMHLISLPELFSDIDRISFIDLMGNGTSCILFTKIAPSPRHYYYDFVSQSVDSQDGPPPSAKPYLLNQINNNLGSVTQIVYTSSVNYYLEDKKKGKPWATNLPFPVQVVESLTKIDQISGAKNYCQYSYHEGYYDPIGKSFRGFGYVETQDTETYEQFLQSNNPDYPVQALNEDLYVPPALTRKWFITGAYFGEPVISKQYAQQYYQGDPDAYDMPDSILAPDIYKEGYQTIRQAFVALSGRQIREEVYGLDGTILSTNPYLVTEQNYDVLLLQEKGNNRYASYQVNSREEINYSYERDPSDPRVEQAFTLDVDAYGNITQACTIYLSRRNKLESGPVIYPEQQMIRATVSKDSFINETGENRWIGLPSETQEFEIAGLQANVDQYFDFDAVALQVQDAFANTILFGKPFTPDTRQSRLFNWTKIIYWDNEQLNPLEINNTGKRALIHHVQKTAFPDSYVKEVFGAKVNEEILYEQGGYFLDEDEYWWNKGLVQIYYGPNEPERFFQPWTTQNTFAIQANPPQRASLQVKTELSYDTPYYLNVTAYREFFSETESNNSFVSIDYQNLKPYQLIDPNDNIYQWIYDPLGLVIVEAIYGSENAKVTGSMLLYPVNELPATYQRRYTTEDGAPISFADVLISPEYYLQGALSYFFYDLTPWVINDQPANYIQLLANDYYYQSGNISTITWQTQIAYSDGFGNTIEKKEKADPGEAVQHATSGQLKVNEEGELVMGQTTDRWRVSGRTVYNNKNKPAEQYLPYFSDGPFYEEQHEIIQQYLLPPPTTIQYDPLMREIRTNSSKGFFSKVVLSPWENQQFDQDDTVLNSPYYINFIDNYPSTPDQNQKDEKDALDKAAVFFNTPSIAVMNNKGQTFLNIQNNLGNVPTDAFKSIVTAPMTSQDVWDELELKGYLDSEGWVSATFQPYISGFVLELGPSFQPLAESITLILVQNCLTTYLDPDIQDRILESIDPRLYYSNISTGTSYFNFLNAYSMFGEDALVTNSIDAGTSYHLQNIFLKEIQLWNANGNNLEATYDCLRRPTGLILLSGPLDSVDLPILVNKIDYGEGIPNAADHNLRGEKYKQYDQAGIETIEDYGLQKGQLHITRALTEDFDIIIDWTDPTKVNMVPDPLTSMFVFDAMKRLTSETTPDGSIKQNSYNMAGLLYSIDLLPNQESLKEVVSTIDYNANNQRLMVAYGNGVRTNYAYESTTDKLLSIKSTRPDSSVNGNQMNQLQNLSYTYDPVGNITRCWDYTSESVYCNNQRVDPLSDYVYDALYQLICASGRQHKGIQANAHINGFKQSIYGPLCPTNPNDPTQLENYIETYMYDMSGNLILKKHIADQANWTTSTPVDDDSNHLSERSYDNAGNLLNLQLNSLTTLNWNYKNQLASTGVIIREDNIDDMDYFNYDLSGIRKRKTIERLSQGSTEKEVYIYFGSYEVKQIITASGQIILNRQGIRIMDNNENILITYFWEKDNRSGDKNRTGSRHWRYQMCNQQNSISVETDQNAAIISYEEYFPFGGTAIIAGKSQSEVELKVYRFTGKERDDTTGLYYYGQRYYAPWLGRWISADPAGNVDGLNLYAYVSNNPLIYTDPTGLAKLNRQVTRRTGQRASTIASTMKVRGRDTRRVRGVNRRMRTTWRSRLALAAARAINVGQASAAMIAHAAANPGSYAAAYVADQAFNRNRLIGSRPLVADHFTTDWSQRGPSIARASNANNPDTYIRPAFQVPEHLHLAHPTTGQGHGAGTIAYQERQLQLGIGVPGGNLQEGRFLATQLHMNQYYADPNWNNVALRYRASMKASFVAALNQPSQLHNDAGALIGAITLTGPRQATLLAQYNANTP